MAGLALPLILTTLMGQFLPGTAILRANGYDVAARPVVALWALALLPSGLLGGSPRRPPGHGHRYAAGGACGAFFLLDRLLAGTIAQLLKHLPVAVIALLAGLALLGAIMKSLRTLSPEGSPADRQAGLLAFMVTSSSVSVMGIGSAFWGVVVGIAAVGLSALAARVKRA
ncbi:benzoate/H(+) symporter BenE family transporter [Paracoccus sp. MC1854]|nr:benzoate/H(+) symporter BenE family transporter [Paracoccus sp. MC1854]